MITYTINFTSGTKPTFTIAPGEFDGPAHLYQVPPQPDKAHTSLNLYGQGTLRYGEKVDEDLVALLENFANTTAPLLPTSGQLWFDTAHNTLKVYANDLQWNAFPFVEPTVPKSGDIHVSGAIVFMYANGAWRQIFPAVYS